MALCLNTKIDAQFSHGQAWYIATIIDTNDKQIKIHYDCDGENSDDDQWIDKNSDKIAKLNTYTVPVTQLTKTPNTIEYCAAVYYKHNDMEYILLCMNEHSSIHRYDINTAKWEKYSNYPEELMPRREDRICFDDEGLQIHFININYHYELDGKIMIHAVFDVVSKKWTLSTCNVSDFDVGKGATSCLLHIPSPAAKLHYFHSSNHYQIIDVKSAETVKSKSCQLVPLNDDANHEFNNITWCDALNKLVTVRDQWISVCDIDENKQDEYHWIRYGVESDTIPHLESNDKLILAYKYILFAFFSSNRVCCIDLLHGKSYMVTKWIAISGDTSIVKGNDNYIYLIDCNYQTNERMSLLDIIPEDLHRFWRMRISNPLVFGYIAMMNQKYNLSNSVPFDIANLLWSFYPTFCE